AQAIIDKAIKAHGGAEKLAKFKAVQTSGKGTIEVMGMTLSFTAEGAAQMPDKFKSALHLEIAGMKVTQVQAMNGDKITITVNGIKTRMNEVSQNDGHMLMDVQPFEVKYLGKLDDSTFDPSLQACLVPRGPSRPPDGTIHYVASGCVPGDCSAAPRREERGGQ